MHTESHFAASVCDAPRDSVVATWRLVCRLGAGRWSRVFRARPVAAPLDAPADYAIKLLRRDAEESLGLRLLQREAQIGRQLSHPHLVTVLAAQLDRPPYFLVMPFLDGLSARGLLDRHGSLEVPWALWIVRQAADALRDLHRAGWLHGDIKPGNLHVAPHGHVTVLDLGFARYRTGRATEFLAATPAYSAPELLREDPPSPQADIYSLGVTLYELLTGHLPFPQRDPEQLALAHLRELPPELRSFAPHVSCRVAELVRSMLAKEPLRRPDAEELIARLFELEFDAFDERVAA